MTLPALPDTPQGFIQQIKRELPAIRVAGSFGEVLVEKKKTRVMEEFARQKGWTSARPWLGAKTVSCDRRMGELLREMAESGERRGSGGDYTSEHGPDLLPSSLDGLGGISKNQSSRWQSIAIIPEADFDAELADLLAADKIPAANHFERLGRDIIAANKHQRRDTYRTPPEGIDLRGGDFRQVLNDLEPGSVDLVLTDPPYPEEWLSVWSDLGAFAARVLKPGGLLAAYCGQYHLWEYGDRLRPHLKPWWVGCVVHDGAWLHIASRKVQVGWKPILFFVNGDRAIENMADLVQAEKRREKMGHKWEQNLAEAETLIAMLTEPGHLVVDPFAGTGTIPLAADRLGRRWAAAELNKDTHAEAIRRIEQSRRSGSLP